LWDRYVVGTADNIPAEEASLDFIFSSHVVEHLANPLGHLAYWAKLLKPGGLVVAVIPDKDGCQDYAFAPSTVAEIMAEWEAGSMQVTIEHYRRWGKIQMPGSTAEALMESGRSIHVHFYTPAFMANLLAQTVARLGFQRFTVTSQPNHKDFHVVLEK
jgi:ubiquinone/menaquinone biosynthesis C-methylase UbiE